jgi:hypothetical protein
MQSVSSTVPMYGVSLVHYADPSQCKNGPYNASQSPKEIERSERKKNSQVYGLGEAANATDVGVCVGVGMLFVRVVSILLPR